MSEPTSEAFVVEDEQTDLRLDALLVARYPQHSRAAIQRSIAAGHVQVDGRQRKSSYRVSPGEAIAVAQFEVARPGPEPEEIPLSILYEDDDLIVVDKPAGMIVHPAKGHWAGTLASALAFRFQSLSGVGGPTRPGIVHRLDRETSGVIVVAKHDRAHHALADQFKSRTVEKTYWALVVGRPDRDEDLIDRPIGAHPHYRERMAVRADHSTSRPAQTRMRVVERFAKTALIAATPLTGRTHQIRVHLASVGSPVLCDKLYGGRSQITRGELWPDAQGDPAELILQRQALHAQQLQIDQPTTGERLSFSAPLPSDLAHTIRYLRQTEDCLD
ncbi:Pseudouridine synthase [Pirellulimonas nuda]|uniref:Pseudouridine synthase n=1 Tax=Pirellulimonas nuda TaxID=2528009 RepID=A0A518DI41_9BACT|nr:RluA family pseudouridine synthase [Pirellulimonas nuda]QDU91151.1 Pseudouridine synthase [Pirellulimonas nuda]